MRVLVVDDEVKLASLLQRRLRAHGDRRRRRRERRGGARARARDRTTTRSCST